jgi:hypothetical protein
MDESLHVDTLDVERLLADWRWLCPSPKSLLARNVFGDLFLQDDAGAVFWLNTATGKMNKISNSKKEFIEMAETAEKRREWFAEQEMLAYAKRGLVPNSSQCIGFGVPAIFAEGGKPDTAYVVDIYEQVSFLGDLHRQIANLPDGSKVRLCVNPPKPASPEQT